MVDGRNQGMGDKGEGLEEAEEIIIFVLAPPKVTPE